MAPWRPLLTGQAPAPNVLSRWKSHSAARKQRAAEEETG
jgi:hypothetical protein